jgi:aspartate-semialdehyde dehydrogenase
MNLDKAQPLKVALVGAETLLGRELQEVLGAQPGYVAISAFSANGEDQIGEEGEEIYVDPLSARMLNGASAIVVAGTAEGAEKAADLVKAGGEHPPLIDCTGHFGTQPEARIVAPLLRDANAYGKWLLVIAHPAASALALILAKLATYGQIRRALAHVFEPASERGKRGLSELHQQTTNLLSFKSIDKAVFDAQLSFNLLSQYGEEAPVKLLTIEQRIERDLATILAGQSAALPMPSLRLIQAPVFHGYGISLWVEFASNADPLAIGESLASAQIEVRGQGQEAPNGVGVAGQSGLIAGDIRVDCNNPRAAWIWIVADNLRLIADDAAAILTALGGDPH